MYKLIIYDEKGATREFDLSPGTFHLGRSKKNDIYLNDIRVSRSHAQIQLDPDGNIFIEDLNSKEGTTVNGESIDKKTDLKDGDEIAISSFTIEVKKWSEEMQTVAMASPTEREMPLSDSETDLGPDGTIRIDPGDPDDAELPRYHKLLIISDKRFGEEYLLDKPALTIGSSASKCNILIDEEKVSAEHARLLVSDGESVLENLAAAKETLVNRKYVKKKISLKKGDRIEIGSVKFRFIDRDEVVQKDELNSRTKPKGAGKNKKKTLVMALVFVTAILVLLVLYKPQKEPSEPGGSVVQPEPKAGTGTVSPEAAKTEKAPDEISEEDLSVKQKADIDFNLGNEFFKKRLWKEATRKFEEVLQSNAEYPGAFDQMEEARNEDNNLQLLEKSRSLIAMHDYEKGLKELEQIPGDSIYYDESLAEIKTARAEMPKKKASAVKRVESSIPKKKPIVKIVSKEKEGNRLIESAIEDYLIGKTNNAFNKLNAVLKLDLENENLLKQKASNLLGDLKNVLDFFHNGHTEYNNNQIDKAFDTWSKGLVLEKRVMGKKISHDSKSIRNIIADREAREARKAFESGDFPAAHKLSEKALTIYPENEDSLEISKLLYLRAKKLFEEGYIIKDLDTDRSVLKMKEVLSITSPGSEYYKKAKSIIASFTGLKH